MRRDIHSQIEKLRVLRNLRTQHAEEVGQASHHIECVRRSESCGQIGELVSAEIGCIDSDSNMRTGSLLLCYY